MSNNLVSMYSGDVGSKDNEGVNKIEDSLFSDRVGKIVISNRSSDKSSAIMVSDDGIKLCVPSLTSGVNVQNDGITIQGTTTMTSKAENVRKGEFSENPKSSKIFTYSETVLMESIPADVASKMAGVAGLNTPAMDGNVPIYTDISAGPLPHLHSISMKHVHRVEPAYLYRIPSAVQAISGAMKALSQFFNS